MFQIGVDLVEETMMMIGGLQQYTRTQYSQYVLNEVNWVRDDPPLRTFA